MPLHLLKLAVGIDDIDHLRRIRQARAAERGGSWVYTRNHPRRAEEVLAGGSIYWVIRGQIRVRQRVTGLRGERDDNGPPLLPDRGRCGAGADSAAGVAAVPGLAISGLGGRAARSVRYRRSRPPTGCSRNCARSA